MPFHDPPLLCSLVLGNGRYEDPLSPVTMELAEKTYIPVRIPYYEESPRYSFRELLIRPHGTKQHTRKMLLDIEVDHTPTLISKTLVTSTSLKEFISKRHPRASFTFTEPPIPHDVIKVDFLGSVFYVPIINNVATFRSDWANAKLTYNFNSGNLIRDDQITFLEEERILKVKDNEISSSSSGYSFLHLEMHKLLATDFNVIVVVDIDGNEIRRISSQTSRPFVSLRNRHPELFEDNHRESRKSWRY